MVLDCRGLDRGIPILLTWLQREGVIPGDTVPLILDAMGERGLTCEEAVVGLAGIGELDIAQRYADYFRVPIAEEAQPLERQAALHTVLPANFCRLHVMVPVARTGAGVVIAMADPSRIWLHSQITMMTGLELDVRVAPLSRVKSWIDRLHGVAAAPTSRAEIFEPAVPQAFVSEVTVPEADEDETEPGESDG